MSKMYWRSIRFETKGQAMFLADSFLETSQWYSHKYRIILRYSDQTKRKSGHIFPHSSQYQRKFTINKLPTENGPKPFLLNKP